MPLDLQEIIEDGGEIGVFIGKVKAFASTLPGAGEPVSAEVIAAGLALLLPDLGRLVDKIRTDIAD